MDPIGEGNIPSQSISDQPTPPITSSEPEVSVLPLIISIVLFISVAVVGTLVYQNKRHQQQIATILQPAPTLTPTPTPDPTVNWKSYNFSPTILFKLPPVVKDPLYINAGRYAQETTLPDGTTLQIWGANGASPTGGKDRFNTIKRSIVSNPIFQTKILEINSKEAVEFTAATSSSELIVGGNDSIRLKGVLIKTSDGRGFVAIHYLNQTLPKEVNFNSDDLIFDQILTTFKFTILDKPPCGGEAHVPCPDGYICNMESDAPNANGVCTKQP